MNEPLKDSFKKLSIFTSELDMLNNDKKNNWNQIRAKESEINKEWKICIEMINNEIPEFIKNGINEDAIVISENIGKYLNFRDLTTSQIRNFFGEVKRIQMKSEDLDLNSIALLQPKLVYAAARAKKDGTNDLKLILNTALKTVIAEHSDENKKKTLQKFNNFSNFFEAILAYHKSYGGK